jgi:hypothetical protein
MVAALLILAMMGLGQSFTASVRGTVTDQSAAAIPGAKIVVSDVNRGTIHTTQSDEVGRFTITALQPGAYVLTVEAAGFQKFSSGQFTLVVQQQATIDAKMQVGDITTTVEVTGSAALVNTTIANLGQVVENKYIISLPNIARNTMSLTYLTPGVVGAGGRPGDNNTNFVANGSRNSTSDVLLDGVTVVTVEQNSGITDLKFSPSVDAVQEFKMQTNFFSAEYGQTGGAVVNMITKSGTNDFHGTGYYFLRHSDLNANNWFSNRANRVRPNFRRDQPGAVVTGPVIKNKTFFMGSYEFTRQEAPLSQTASFPTLLQREGDFSQTFNTSAALMQIYNPFSIVTAANGTVTRNPFANNRIPTSLMDPVALKALAYFPKPNQPAQNQITQQNNWFEQGINKTRSHQTNMRGDHNFTENNRLTGRYSYNRGTNTPPNLFGDLAPAFTFNNGPNRGTAHAMVTEFTRVQNSTSVWNIRYGLTYSTYFRNPMEEFDLTTLGFPQYMKDNATFKVFPTIAPDGFTDIGTEGWLIMDRQEGVHHITGAYSKILGGHNMKVGAETRRNFLDYAQPGYPAGRVAFGRGITCADLFTCPANQGNGLATMLLGWGTGSDYHIDPKVFSRSAYYGFFFQDDWKITSKLTLNLGLRYDFDVPRWEKLNRESYWDLNAQSPIQVQGLDTRGVFRFVNDDKRSPFEADMNNWQPRIGFAYALNPKTAIRAGYGLFYQLSRATVYGHTGSGFTVNSQANFSLDANRTLYARLSNPYPDGMLLPVGSSLGERTFLGLNAGTILGTNNRNPEYHSWNFSIQREVGWNSVVEINYTGSRGTHLFLPFTSLSPLAPQYWSMGRTALNARVDNPFFGLITDPRANNLNGRTVQLFRLLRPMPHFDGTHVATAEPARADSNYHALQIKWEKRYSSGLTFLTHYTWSKMIDNSSHGSGNYSWLGGGTAIQNIWDLRGERSYSAHDVPQRLVLTGAYELPFGTRRRWGSNWNKPMDLILGGWEISGMMIGQSGMPLHITQNGGVIWDGTQRPNLIGDPSTSGRIQDRLNRWFNEAAFSQPAQDVPGSAPRTLNYRGPGIRSFNAALLKSFRVVEGQRFEFRLEAQNAFNHPIFGDPNTAYGSTSFGQITATKVGPREVQIGLKYYF